MKQDALFNLWKQDDEHIASIAPDLNSEKMKNIQIQSNNILAEVVGKSFRDIAYGVLLAFASAFACKWDAVVLTFLGLAVLVALLLYSQMYLRLKRRIYTVNQQNIKSAIQEYLNLIKTHRQNLRLLTYAYVTTVIGLAIILSFWPLVGTIAMSKIALKIFITMLVATPFLLGYFRFELEPYLQKHYDPSIERLTNLYEAL